MLHPSIPENFLPKFEVVSCFMEHDRKILLLHRQGSKSEGGKWGLPAGKIEKNETSIEALCREVFEETGINIDSSDASFLGTLAVTHGDRDFLYHSFRVNLEQTPAVTINPVEHQNFTWKNLEDVASLPLVTDLDECIFMYYPAIEYGTRA